MHHLPNIRSLMPHVPRPRPASCSTICGKSNRAPTGLTRQIRRVGRDTPRGTTRRAMAHGDSMAPIVLACRAAIPRTSHYNTRRVAPNTNQHRASRSPHGWHCRIFFQKSGSSGACLFLFRSGKAQPWTEEEEERGGGGERVE